MKTFKVFSGSLIVLLVGFSLVTAVFAAGPATPSTPPSGAAAPPSPAAPESGSTLPRPQGQVQGTMQPGLKPAADLVLVRVEYSPCPCTSWSMCDVLHNQLDTEFLTNTKIYIVATNHSHYNPVRARLKAKYYDRTGEQWRVIIKEEILPAGMTRKIQMGHPITALIKKSAGTTGSIEHVDDNFTDPDMSNNSITTYGCWSITH